MAWVFSFKIVGIKNNMKKLILLLFIPLLFACSDDEEIISEPKYSIEGKWLIEGTVPAGNTMYL